MVIAMFKHNDSEYFSVSIRALIQHKDMIFFTSLGNASVDMMRSYDRLISTIGFPIWVSWHL